MTSCREQGQLQLYTAQQHTSWWAGQLSRYSDWLHAGRFGDRIPVGTRLSAPVQTGPGVHPTSCTISTGSFPGGKERPGRDADPSPLCSAVVKEEQSQTSTPPMGRTACTEPQCLYKGDLYVYLIHFVITVTLAPPHVLVPVLGRLHIRLSLIAEMDISQN